MKKTLLLVVLFMSLYYSSYSQVQLETTISAGGTLINIENLVAIDEITNTTATDWGHFTSGLSGQIFYFTKGDISVGTELMYQYLYWYSVRIPYGDYPIYREYDISVFKIAQICRFRAKNDFNFDIGPEINISSDGIMLGILGSVNYYFRINDKIDIPLKLRAELLSGIVLIAPVTINAGIRINL